MFSYILLFPHSLRPSPLGNSLNQNVHTNALWQGWDGYVQSESEGKREMRQERRVLPVISQENAASYLVIWGISGQGS